MAAVAVGAVGLVLSLEASRLARTDQDWCRLLELYPLFDTLIADADTVYDVSTLDDQLVLGIKATMRVAELKVLHQRVPVVSNLTVNDWFRKSKEPRRKQRGF